MATIRSQAAERARCGQIAALLSEICPELAQSRPSQNMARPPPPTSFVKAQEARGVVIREFAPVGFLDAVALALTKAPAGVERHIGDAGAVDDYVSKIVDAQPETVCGVAPKHLTMGGYTGAMGGAGLAVHDACEVRCGETWYDAVVVRIDGGVGDAFSWEETTFVVDLNTGPRIQSVTNDEIREVQCAVERLRATGLDDKGARYYDAASAVGRAILKNTTVDPAAAQDAVLSRDVARERARGEAIAALEEGGDDDAPAPPVAPTASSHAEDDAAAPVEPAPTTKPVDDAMDVDARDALPDAAAPPEPAAAPVEVAPAPEPSPTTPANDVESDRDAAMPDAPPAWRVLAVRWGEVVDQALSKTPSITCLSGESRPNESAPDYVERLISLLEKSPKRGGLSQQDAYQKLASVLDGVGRKLADRKSAISAALQGRTAADFLAAARAPEPEAAAPAPAPPGSTSEQAWEPDARKMLDEVKDLAAGKLGPILTRYGFTVTSKSKKFSDKNPASPAEDWPSVFDVIGQNYGGKRDQDVIDSKTKLVSYLEEALKQARDGTSFRSQSQKKAEDAAAALVGPTPSEKKRANLAKANAIKCDLGEEDVDWWHDLANETWRHGFYRDMKANGVFIGKEPFLLVSPSGKQPPRHGVRGFYAGTLPPGESRRDMTEEKCTTTEQLEAWEEAKRVCQILNGVGDEDGVYKLEYDAWKDMGGDGSVVGSREERQDYSERGLYATAIRDAINALRRDNRRRFSSLALKALRGMIGRSERHVAALARHAGVDKEDLIRTNSSGREYFVSGSGPCQLPGPLHGLLRPLNIEHVNGTWADDGSATLELKVRGFEDEKFNKAEPHYAFVKSTLGVRAFVDGYLHHGALCCSEDDAVRALFQMKMDPISTTAREEFLAKPVAERQSEEMAFLKDTVMARVVNPKTDEDRRRREILYARHDCLAFADRRGRGAVAVSCVPERKKEFGKWYGAEILRQYGSGSAATFDVKFDDGYVAKGVAAGDVRQGRGNHLKLAPDVGMTGEACYRGTKLDLDHVGLGWRWERVTPSEKYPDGLKWYRILGIRDLLDYDINRNLSGYEWIKNLDLVDYIENYYANAFYKVGGGGLTAEKWVFKWTPAKGWAYGAFS
jgi:hypothetical protein